MAVMGSLSRVWGCRLLLMKQAVIPLSAPLRTLSTLSWMPNLTQPSSSLSISSNFLARALPSLGTLMPVRTKKRGMEYQPKFLKRKRTHGWLKRISTRGGIEVILRRMLKGRKSLTH